MAMMHTIASCSRRRPMIQRMVPLASSDLKSRVFLPSDMRPAAASSRPARRGYAAAVKELPWCAPKDSPNRSRKLQSGVDEEKEEQVSQNLPVLP